MRGMSGDLPGTRPALARRRWIACGKDEAGDSLGGVRLHRWCDVLIDVPGDGRRRMAQPLRDDLDVHTRLEGEGRPGVTEIVQTDAWHTVALHASIELTREAVRVVGTAIGVAEHEVLILVSGSEQ